ILGAASYASGKLIKLLINHPYTKITYLVSETYTNQEVESSHSFLKNVLNMEFKPYDLKQLAKNCDVVFMSKPHGYAFQYAPELLGKGIVVIDLSADYRLKDPKKFEEWYKVHNPNTELFKEAVYGLPEIHAEEIKKARLIGNPGCYPTSVILGVAPIFKEGIVEYKDVIIDSLSGISGAGKSRGAENQFLDISDNIKAYKIGTHAHTPEIEQELSLLGGEPTIVLFAPHVAPFKYGIMSTIYLRLKNNKISEEELYLKYLKFYEGKPFVRIYKPGTLPEIKDAVDSNFCDIGIKIDKRTKMCVVTSVIDNLIKGAAGQAIQNMNLIFKLDEVEGLPFSAALKAKNRKIPDDRVIYLSQVN
ncbi:MAG: N-acetyl-gamma-glutamyl-phosphate reductase, partial [Deltaproteobacteria bacterium]|nr:N-acetyl-gamma-glutamyl-phosphate reductase [Deltaproteobacteria bacterium]